MNSIFRTELDVRFVEKGKGGTYVWRLLSPLIYYSAILGRDVIIPTDFETNFASIFYKTHPKPVVLHDYLWWLAELSRSKSNAIYLEAMNVTEDVNKIRRYARYGAVQISQFFWKK